MRWPHRLLNRPRDERGSVAIEAALGLPAFGLFVALIIMGGRLELARQAVETAAYDAARAASIERSVTVAGAAGSQAASSSLDSQGLDCVSRTVNVNTSGFNAPPGTTGQVVATVSCTVKLGDLAIPGVPGTKTITESRSSPVDVYREQR